MTQVQLTDQELNRALAELLGYASEKHGNGYRLISPDGTKVTKTAWVDEDYAWDTRHFCTDPTASLEVQAKAIEVNADEYVQNLAIVKWGEPDEDVEDTAVWNKTMRYSIAELLTASPRERAEAAYITLQGAK
ncbi:hypothetical protein [Paenibacillus sp. BAC0078]